MDKQTVLLPFIFVYKAFLFVWLFIKNLFKYTSLGFFFTTTTFITIIINGLAALVIYSLKGFVYILYLISLFFKVIIIQFFKYVFKGFVVLSQTIYKLFTISFINFFNYAFKGLKVVLYYVYRFFKLVFYGLLTPFVLAYKGIVVVFDLLKKQYHKGSVKREKNKALQLNKKKRREETRILKQEKREREKQKRLEEKQKKQELSAIKRQEERARKKEHQKKLKDEYRNENVEIEKKTIGDRINDFLTKLIEVPASITQGIKDKIHNSSFNKNIRNKRELKKEALLIDFQGEDAKRSAVKIMYEYVAKDRNGKVIKGYFEAFSKVEVHSFLLSEEYEVYSIRTNKWIAFVHGGNSVNSMKIKNKDLLFFLTQLSTYLKAGIPLVDSLKILTRQFKKKSYQRIFRSMVYDLTMGESFSDAMSKQGVAFPKLLVNMVKTAEMTGQLPEVLDEMAEYFTEIEKTRKQMITALIYPSIVLVLSLAATTFIMMFVVPRFVEIYESMDASQIPKFTLMVIGVSDYLEKNLLIILISVIVFLMLLIYLYKNVKLIRTFLQWIAMHVPGFSNIIIYNEVTMFTKTFSSLLAHNIFITDSMEVLNRITNNEIFKMLILDAISNVARGDKISKSFENHWAFPVPAYEMIVTGESTGQLPEMMAKVSEYYQELHRNAVTRLKTLIEPALIVFLTAIVGVIVLSIVIPMFNSFQMLQQ